ncbi:AMP-binding protein [Zavarzinia sp. CC-PAN008]|uniref:AMP-binding protein n=1 Tax=Zavarzinia sp. CC-PAN008 TaxID=3243332 RepID=UPI003F746809
MASGEAAAAAALHEELFGVHLLANALNQGGDRPLIHMTEGGTLSVRDVRDLTSQYAQALKALGLKPGTRIAMLSANRPEVLFAGNAASLAGCVVVPLHPMGAIEDYVYVVEDAGIEALIFDPVKFEGKAKELLTRVPQVKTVLSFGPAGVGHDLAAKAAGFDAGPLVAPKVNGDEIVRLSYSGGTTGKPKAIMGNHRNGLATLTIMLSEWEWPASPRVLVCAPLSHSGAALFLPTLLKGGSLVVQPGFDPLAVLQAIDTYRINCTLLVPTMIYALLDHPRFDEFNLRSMETIFYGASLMSPARLKEAIERIGPVFFQFYGQAEAPMTVTVMRKAEHDPTNPKRLESCGRPVPFVHVALLDSENREVADGEPGEICVRGPLVMSGYLNKPEQTAETFSGGWLHTGDVAVKDPDGFLRIVDRKKDMIITGGFNVYPREVEDVLSSHPAVAQAAVIGVPHEKWGETVTACIVLRPGQSVEAAELISLVHAKKGSVQAPKTVHFIDAVPQTPVGKPDKKALRVRFGGTASAASAGSPVKAAE